MQLNYSKNYFKSCNCSWQLKKVGYTFAFSNSLWYCCRSNENRNLSLCLIKFHDTKAAGRRKYSTMYS